MEVSGPQSIRPTTLPAPTDPISAFPTSGQPISDTVLKEMLLSLRVSLHADIVSGVNQCQADVQAMGEKINHIEHTIGEYSISFNTLVDAHTEQKEEIVWLKGKIADLEDRSRRNNIKIRSIPESISAPQLQLYAQTLFSSLAPELSALQLPIDRIHRVPKPSFLPSETPRDVLLRVHYYHVKEQLLAAFLRIGNTLDQYA